MFSNEELDRMEVLYQELGLCSEMRQLFRSGDIPVPPAIPPSKDTKGGEKKMLGPNDSGNPYDDGDPGHGEAKE